jgi:hypothetical protein
VEHPAEPTLLPLTQEEGGRMSQIIYGSTNITIKAGASISILIVYNSPSIPAGGDYLGPVALAALANKTHIRLTVTETGIEPINRNPDGLTTTMIYNCTVRNDSSKSVWFRLDTLSD